MSSCLKNNKTEPELHSCVGILFTCLQVEKGKRQAYRDAGGMEDQCPHCSSVTGKVTKKPENHLQSEAGPFKLTILWNTSFGDETWDQIALVRAFHRANLATSQHAPFGCMCVIFMQKPVGAKGGMVPGTGVQKVVSLHVGTRNQTQILCKS